MTTDNQIDYVQNIDFVVNKKRMTTVKDLIRDYGREIHKRLAEYPVDSVEHSQMLHEMEEEALNETMKRIRNLFE